MRLFAQLRISRRIVINAIEDWKLKYEAQSALLFFSKKRQLVSPLLSLDYRRTATVGSYWRGMGEAIDCDEKKCVLKRLKTLSFIPPVHLFISNFASY